MIYLFIYDWQQVDTNILVITIKSPDLFIKHGAMNSGDGPLLTLLDLKKGGDMIRRIKGKFRLIIKVGGANARKTKSRPKLQRRKKLRNERKNHCFYFINTIVYVRNNAV